ncbi:MAG: glycoside hydrolase family 16 protein [Capsulimonadaceae bacterium]|nr:glycoside hydrolase family 16 protein [Capsulimonadaceae bacterium]
MNRHFIILLWAFGALIAIAASGLARAQDAAHANVLCNGSFAQHKSDGSLSAWTAVPATWRPGTTVEGGESLVTLKTTDHVASCALRQTITVRPEWAKIVVRGYVRVTQTPKETPAASGSNCASASLQWRMKSTGTVVEAATQRWAEITNGWVEINLLLDVPPGASQLIVTPQVVGANGSADFRGFSVVAWVTTFDDEFNGSSIDPRKWTVSDGCDLLYAPGEQYFAPDHVIVEGGIARFHADNVAHPARGPRPPLDGIYANTLYGDYRYQSGEIRSIGKFQQLYGCWEFRLKIPVVTGTWPAAYLLKWDEGWPPEIDVEECSGNIMQTVIQTDVYSDGYGRMQRSWANFPSAGLDRSTWHTYAITWEPTAISWYIDGVYRGATKAPEAGIPDVPMYIRLNLAVGTFGGDPAKSSWPQDMDCDYVHVYQRSDFPLPLYLEPSQEITLPTKSTILNAISCSPVSNMNVRWTLIEGPGAATIHDPHALKTQVTFSKPGMYRFQLAVAKGATSAARDLLVYVNPGR